MKRLLLALTTLLFWWPSQAGTIHLPSVAEAQMTLMVAGGSSVGGGAPEATLQQSASATPNVNLYFGRNSTSRAAVSFTATATYYLDEFRFAINKVGTGGDCDCQAVLYSSDGSTALATSTNVFNSSTFDGSQLTWTFAGAYQVVDTTAYRWAIVAESGACGDTSNYPNFPYQNSGSLTISYYNGSWTNYDTSSAAAWEAWGH